jgi:hypothetical protein
MQWLTPDQQKVLTDLGWKAVEGIVWTAALWGGRSLLKSVRSIRPGIVEDVTTSVNSHFDTKMAAHDTKDDTRFAAVDKRMDQQFAAVDQRFDDLEDHFKAPHRRARPAHGD